MLNNLILLQGEILAGALIVFAIWAIVVLVFDDISRRKK
jgi:hypothetical protein